jgi:hypothetical protein
MASLFGAVMKNVKSSAAASNNHHLSTPAKQSVHGDSGRGNTASFLSPGGFQLQNFISGFGNSPFQAATATTPSSANKTPSSSKTTAAAATLRRDVEWHECNIERSYLGLIDWSLKSALNFECQLALSGLLYDTAAAQHQMEVMHRFMNSTSAATNNSVGNSSTAAVNGNAGLLYWQHPAICPLPNHLLRGQTTGVAPATYH